MKITEEGLILCNEPDKENDSRKGWWNYKMVIPNVPSGAAVYLRVKDLGIDKEYESTNSNGDKAKFFYMNYQFASMNAKAVIGSDDNSKLLDAKDNSGDQIMAIYNSGDAGNLTLTLNGWLLKKMAVSDQAKTVNVKGWTTESRAMVIDPELTKYLTGENFESCFVTGVDYDNFTVTIEEFADGDVVGIASNGDHNAYIIHNKANVAVDILNGGFHLFVPDMHDYVANGTENQKSVKNMADYLLVSQVTSTNGAKSIPQINGDYTNYALTYKYYDEFDAQGNPTSAKKEGDEAFYRIDKGGASSAGNQGYLPLLTANVTNANGIYLAKPFTFVYAGDEDLTGIKTTETVVTTRNDGVFYNLNGQKINGVPTTRGLYIVNGKKILVK